MSVRRLSQLQWFGLFVGGLTWWGEYLAGTGASQAKCNPGSARWGIPHDTLQLALMLVGVVVVGAALVASAFVFKRTYDVEEQDAPPLGRIHFFSAAATVANLIFLVIILETGIATIVDRVCHQA
jgi:hypothetical protein